MQGEYTLRYEILPFRGEKENEAFQEAWQFQTQLTACHVRAGREGTLPSTCSFFGWKGDGLNLTGMKRKEDSEDIIVRWVNYTAEAVTLEIERKEWIKEVYQTNVVEENLGLLAECEEGGYRMTIRPHEIAGVGVVTGK